jgi:hypothetical protein
MSNMIVQVEPAPVPFTVVAIKIGLSPQIVPDSSATFPVVYLDANGDAIKSLYLVMDGDDYTNWGSSDREYITAWALGKLGLTVPVVL